MDNILLVCPGMRSQLYILPCNYHAMLFKTRVRALGTILNTHKLNTINKHIISIVYNMWVHSVLMRALNVRPEEKIKEIAF